MRHTKSTPFTPHELVADVKSLVLFLYSYPISYSNYESNKATKNTESLVVTNKIMPPVIQLFDCDAT